MTGKRIMMIGAALAALAAVLATVLPTRRRTHTQVVYHDHMDGIDSAAQFVAAMNRLRRQTGLSYRMLERRAAVAGDVLPRTTLMTALSRTTLPRAELVAAFTKASGLPPEQMRAWLLTRQRLASREFTPEPLRQLG